MNDINISFDAMSVSKVISSVPVITSEERIYITDGDVHANYWERKIAQVGGNYLSAAFELPKKICCFVPDRYKPNNPYETKIMLHSFEADTSFSGGYLIHTLQALTLMERNKHLFIDHHVIDYGAGNGVLAIASLLQGALSAVLVEHNPSLIEVIKENIFINGINDKKRIRIVDTDIELITKDLDMASRSVALINIGQSYRTAQGSRVDEIAIQNAAERANCDAMVLAGYYSRLPIHKSDTPNTHGVTESYFGLSLILQKYGFSVIDRLVGSNPDKFAFAYIAVKTENPV